MSGHSTELLVVRHPETDANVNGRFVGQGESAFTEDGKRQARRLVPKIAAFHPDLVWTSPLLRARLVAEKAAACAGVPLRIDERLLELDFGSAHAMTWEETVEAGIEFDYRSEESPVAPGGESRNQLKARAGAVVDEAVAAGGRHALVCHAGVMRAIFAHAFGLRGDQLWMFDIHNAQLAQLRIAGGTGLLVEYRQG